MKYKVKVISLKRRQDRRDKFSKQFNFLNFEFVDALDGKDYNLTDFDKEFIKGNDYNEWGIHIPSLVCANYTHLNLLKECSEQDLPYFIFEDDTDIIKNIDFDFDDIADKNLDAYWLIKNEPSILAYVVWPQGAKKMYDWVMNVSKLDKGLDWKFLELRQKGLLNIGEIEDNYFTQIPGYDSDIALNGYKLNNIAI